MSLLTPEEGPELLTEDQNVRSLGALQCCTRWPFMPASTAPLCSKTRVPRLNSTADGTPSVAKPRGEHVDARLKLAVNQDRS